MKGYNLPAGYSFFESIGRTYKQVKNPIGTMQESMERFDGTYSVHIGSRRFIVTQDPGFIEYVLKNNHRNYHKSTYQTDILGRFLGKGLLTSNGEYWLKQRRLIQPGFHMDKIQALYEIISATIDAFLDKFPTGENVDVYPYMNRLAFDIVINTLFDIEIPDHLSDELRLFVSDSQEFILKDIRQPHKSWWFKLNGELDKNLRKASRARQIVNDIIVARKQSGERRNDLLDMLLDARYEDTGEPMKNDQIIDEILVLVIAGHETTANALSWTLYLLANHPDEWQKVKDASRKISIRDAVSSDILNAVMTESMRLYPPAYISDRVALADDTFSGFTYPKDIILVLFYYGLHRDAKFWDNPNAFTPDRFLKINSDKIKTKAYYPFGGGPRLCIGNNFAMAEMTIFLQRFAERFDIKPGNIKPQIKALVTLKPDRIILNVRKS